MTLYPSDQILQLPLCPGPVIIRNLPMSIKFLLLRACWSWVIILQMVPYGGRDVPANVSCEEVTLDSSLRPGKTTVLETYSALAHQLRPRPKEILQGDNQRVLLTAAHHTISPYPISSETTEVQHSSLTALRLPLDGAADSESSHHLSIPHLFRDKSHFQTSSGVALKLSQCDFCACVMRLMHF